MKVGLRYLGGFGVKRYLNEWKGSEERWHGGVV